VDVSREELNNLEKQAAKLRKEEMELEHQFVELKSVRNMSKNEKNAWRQFQKSKRIFAITKARLDEIKKCYKN